MMKKFLMVMIAVAMVLGVSSSAFAFSFTQEYFGPIKFKFADYSTGSLYGESSITENNETGYGMADEEEDGWGIFKVATIQTDDGNDTTLWYDGKDGEQLTGMFYGIDDDYWVVDATGLTVESVGGYLDLYLDSATSFSSIPGPDARIDDSNYPNVTDGALFLSTEFASGIKYLDGNPDNDYITYYNHMTSSTSPFTGGGSFYLDVTGGAYESLFDSNRWQLMDDSGNIVERDFFGQFDTTTVGAGKWLVKSEDPIQGATVPEPASMILMGLGLLGATRLRRRKV